MQPEFDLIIFDWDGTLYNSISIIEDCFSLAARDQNLSLSPGAARGTIGLALAQAMERLFPARTPETYRRLVADYRKHYLRLVEKIELYEGVEAELKYLKSSGYRLAVATGKSRVGLERSFRHTGTGHYFESSRCADESGSKPDPTMIFEILTELDIEPDRSLLVGDSIHDIQTARNAGIEYLCVAYGAQTPAELEGECPHPPLNSISELRKFINPGGR